MERQKILLVEDTPTLLKLGKAIFESGGYEVLAANDGLEALDLLDDHAVRLIITDVLMPNMDGYSLCYSIRKNEKYRDIPVIIYSATYTSESDEQLALDIGADLFIRKPATMAFLLNAAKKLISGIHDHSQKVHAEYELSDVMRQYSSRLIEKLEQKNLALEEAQVELTKSEKKFRALVEDIADAISLHDENGNVLYQSPATERILGYMIEETRKMKTSDFYHPDDMPDVLARLKKVLDNPGKPIFRISRMKHKDGRYIWTEGSTTNLLADVNVKAIVANYRDITERKLADEQQKKSYHEIETLLDSTDEIFLTLDTDLNIVTFNKNAKAASIKYVKKELKKGTSVLLYSIPERVDYLKELYSEVLAGEQRQSENIFDLDDGEQAYFRTIMKPILNEFGETEGVFVIERDITESVKKQKQIEFDQYNLNALINTTTDLMWSVDKEYRLITSNSAFDEAIMQRSGREITKGSNVLVTGFPTQQLSRWEKFYERAFSGEVFMVTEYTDAPAEHWADIFFYPIRKEDELIGTACYSHNITNRKIAEDKIKRSEAQLAADQKKFSDLFLQAPSAICILGGDSHVYEMANPLYLQITGKKDIIGKTALEVFPELSEQGFSDVLDSVYKTGVPFVGNEVFMQIDREGNGQLVDLYVNFVYQPYENIQGITSGVFFFANVVTEQVLARKKIEQNEKYFRALVENADDLITVTDKIGNLSYISPALEKLTGCTTEAVTGKSFFAYQHPDNVSELKRKFDLLLHNPGVSEPRSTRFRRKDGSYMWMEGTVINLLQDANVQGIIGNFRDVSAHKLYEQKLINATRLYAFISSINQAIVHTTDEQVLFKEACRISIDIGEFRMAWIGMIDEAYKTVSLTESCNMPPEDIQRFINAGYDHAGPMTEILQTGWSFICNDVENEISLPGWNTYAALRHIRSIMVLPIKKGGKIIGTFNFYASEKNVFDEQEIRLLEEAVGDISFAVDLFEKDRQRKQLKDEIDHSELRLKQAQSIAHFGSWEVNFSTGIVQWSEEACRIYGFPPEENMQTYETWLSLNHPDDLEYILKLTKQAEDTLSSSAFHHRIIRRDGSVRHIYSQAEFELSNDGTPVGMYGVAHDITERMEAEQERAKIIADMVQRNKDLEQFSYIVSHNLRAPVANILGIVDVMQNIGVNKEEENEATGYLAVAAQNLDNVIRDINSILELRYKVSERKEVVKFTELLSEIEYSLAGAITKEQARIVADFSQAGEMVTLKSYIYSIFYNLISNSIKYRQPGIAPVIEIKSEILNNKLLVYFKDNGLGIDLAKYGPQLFGLYKRFHNHVDGKGMGLYMVKAQVESLGGTIAVTSEVNKGTEFKIEFEIS